MPAIATPSLAQLASGLPPEIQDKLGAALRAQETFNQRVNAALQALDPGPWIRPVYQNGWVDSSSTRYVRYRFEDGGRRVRFEGRMKSGTVSSKAFDIGQQFCPAQDLKFAVSSNALFGAVSVLNSGSVTLDNGSNVSADMNFSYAVGS